MFDELLRLYQNNGVLKENNQRLDDLLLHQACPDCQACWADREEGQNDWNRVQMPYIGPLYSSSPVRLVAIGLNLHGHGGLFSVHKHLVQVQFLLKAKHTRMHFGAERYGGMTFHRLAAYCLMTTRTDWEVRDSKLWLGESPLLQDWDALAGGLNSVAFLNAVKCSPDWERSTPTGQMRQRCPLRFLQHELRILQPKALLVLGMETLAAIPFDFDKREELARSVDSSSRVLRCTLPDGITVSVANVVHPTAYGGCAEEVAVNLGRLLKDTNWPAPQLKRSLQQWERLTPEEQVSVARGVGECLELDRQVKEKGIRKVLEEQEEQEKRERQNRTR